MGKRKIAKRNITVALDEDSARWARIEAARRDTSVSALLAGLLRDEMVRSQAYAASMARYLGREPRNLTDGRPLPGREEVHER